MMKKKLTVDRNFALQSENECERKDIKAEKEENTHNNSIQHAW